jgi:hypothetical protein
MTKADFLYWLPTAIGIPIVLVGAYAMYRWWPNA